MQCVHDLLSTVTTTEAESLRKKMWNKNAFLKKALAGCKTKGLPPSCLLLHRILFQLLFLQLMSVVHGFYEGVYYVYNDLF